MRFTSFFGVLALTSMVAAAPLEQLTNAITAGPKLPAPKPPAPKPGPKPAPGPKPKRKGKVQCTVFKVYIKSSWEANTKDSQLYPETASALHKSQAMSAAVVTRKTFFR
jgi:hypothetical protein